MIPRGSGRRVALVVVLAGIVIVGATLLAYRSPGRAKGPANPATSTLTLSLPGPFNGCSVLSPDATATTSAVLDLIRPSAFLTGPSDVLYGEGGAIASAELISLHPETVEYSVAPNMLWSNGVSFGVGDLVTWWHSARSLASINGDGYRDISSMVINKKHTAVIATFSTDFADWNLLFRDVEESGTTSSCAIGQLASQPSLGPYSVQVATPDRLVLISNPEWTINYNRFHEVIITSATVVAARGPRYGVVYAPVASQELVDNLVAHPHFLGQLDNSNDIEEITFSPRTALTSERSIRTALSWLLDRRAIVQALFGTLTFSPSVPTSALFSQGQIDYPAPVKGLLPTWSNSALVDPSLDCRKCALEILKNAGYSYRQHVWYDPSGAEVRLTVVLGPTPLDQLTAGLVVSQWRSAGFLVDEKVVASDDLAAQAVAQGHADAAVFDRPTSTTAWLSARSWGQTPYRDSYPSGVRSAETSKLFTLAQGTFNPATAALTWLKIDHDILTRFWVRPLYTVPSLTEWTSPLANVVPAFSMSGLVDQLTNWGIELPTTTTTHKPPALSVG
jgi:ABC-type transport system substrate-binding protein